MKVHIFQVPYDSGHRSLRMGQGPEHFIENNLREVLIDQGFEVEISIIEAHDPFPRENGTAFELCQHISNGVRQVCHQGEFPLILSGNCISALGTIAGLGAGNSGVIWMDGHADFDTPETALRGFLDAMGLSVITGRCWQMAAVGISGFQPIAGNKVLHLGGRLLPEERMWLNQSHVAFLTADIINASSVDRLIAPYLEALRSRVTHIYLHLDLDVLDSELTPANGFAETGGLSVEQVKDLIELIGSHFTISGCGVASYDPGFDKEHQTLNAGIQLIQTVLSSVRI